MKKIISILLTILLIFISSGCGIRNININNSMKIDPYERPSLLNGVDVTYDEEFYPNLPEYSLNYDLSNVINPWDANRLNDEEKQKLANNMFVLTENGYSGNAFHFVYGENANPFHKMPSFVTVDSILNAFHEYYEYLQKQTEKQYLIGRILEMSNSLLANSKEQLDMLRGTSWESAAQRNVDYFSVAVALSGGSEYQENEKVNNELLNIKRASEITVSPVFSSSENEYLQDYTQFAINGYYTESEELRNYYEVMKWYGMMTFVQNDDELNKSALLINLALNGQALEDFECVYEVTSFFVGEPDNNTYYEYYPIIEFYFGDEIDVSRLPEMEDEYEEYLTYIFDLPKPMINSLVTNERSDEYIGGFRLLGQRASLDSWILDSFIKEGDSSLPGALTVPAILGSDTAANILISSKNENSQSELFQKVLDIRSQVYERGDNLYTMSASSAWLGSLKTLLKEKGEGWPSYSQGNAWNKKMLVSFLGSYAELKHDLSAYSTIPSDASGATGGEEMIIDDRGYVETEPVFFHRLGSIIEAMIIGLDSYGLISYEDINDLNELKETCNIFESISRKELEGILPTNEEFDYIRGYGGLLDKIWRKYIRSRVDENVNPFCVSDATLSRFYPNYVISPIVSNEDKCLEIGEGKPMEIYVAVYFDGEIRLARGVTYSYYELEVPTNRTINDNQWKNVIKSYDYAAIPYQPEWYEDIYVKYEHRNSDYMGIDYLLEKARYNAFIVVADYIKVRDFPSTKTGVQYPRDQFHKIAKGQKYLFYSKVQNEGYTWYRISSGDYDSCIDVCWVADDGTWLEILSESGEMSLFGEEPIYQNSNHISINYDQVEIRNGTNDYSEVIGYAYPGDSYLSLGTSDEWHFNGEGLGSSKTGRTCYRIGSNMWLIDDGTGKITVN